MSAAHPSTPNHQSDTVGSGQTQFFDCQALSADHPEILARDVARQQGSHTPSSSDSHARPEVEGEDEKAQLD